ncbi:MAG: class I SAM-dependent methyltransferase [Hyphomicrobium sp.]
MPNCPICQRASDTVYARARDIEYHTSDAVFDFHTCGPCGILFISPMLADRLADIYPKNYYSFVSGRKSLAVAAKEWLDRRRFRTLLKRLASPRLSVLDIGGGTGWLLDIIKSADARVTTTTVVDIDAEAGATAIKAGHAYSHGRFEDYDGTARFDLILMLNLIEHTANPTAILMKARQLLKSDGLLLIKTPNFDALDARIFRHRSWAGFHTPRHFVLFQRDSLIALCRTCGFDVESFAYVQGAPFWSVSLLEELRRLGLVKISADRPAIYHPLMPLLQISSAAFDMMRAPFSKLSQMELVARPAAETSQSNVKALHER